MERPDTATVSRPADIEDWYWTRAELDAIARRLNVSRTGSKADLTRRLVAVLSGQEPARARTTRRGPQLQPPLTSDDVVPDGQRMTRALREWFVAQVGESFVFDGTMREFFAAPAGRTLGEAVQVWQDSRGVQRAIPEQFEYNRFTREYRQRFPDATLIDARRAWQAYKETPVSQRGRV